MLSRASTRAPQAKQCEGGVTTDMPRGMRAMHTLRKLPQMRAEGGGGDKAPESSRPPGIQQGWVHG